MGLTYGESNPSPTLCIGTHPIVTLIGLILNKKRMVVSYANRGP